MEKMKNEEEKQKLWRLEKKQSCLPKVDEEEEEEEEEFDEAVKLDGVARRLNVQLRSANMPYYMQEHAICFANLLLHNSSSSPTPSLLARSLKKEFDSIYGRVWHCIVGKSFGSFVTHSPGGFIYFSIDSHNLSCLLFKTEVQLITVS